MPSGPVNLFIYGDLANPAMFRAATGCSLDLPAGGRDVPRRPEPAQRRLRATPAALLNHGPVEPTTSLGAATAHRGRQTPGLLVLNVPAEVLAELARFEGPQRERQRVTVAAASGATEAEAFIGVPGRPHAAAGRGRRLKAELALRERIDRLLAEGTTPPDDRIRSVHRRAARELKGATIHQLIGAHLQATELSDFFIIQALAGADRSFEPLRHDEDAALFAENYLSLLIRQVIFNQFESFIFEQFRYEIDRLGGGDRCFEHSVSSLGALRMLSGMTELLATLAMDALNDLDYRRDDLIDFVRWGIQAADNLFEPKSARECVEWVSAHRVGGLLPLGAELVLSNLPHGALSPPGEGARRQADKGGGFDPTYDSFRYFHDFALDLLSWKLGGHVQPWLRAERSGTRGALVCSLGSIARRADRPGEEGAARACPVNGDPWLINQLIRHVTAFCGVRPHALHVSIHLPRAMAPSVETRAVLPESVVRCLLAVGGDVGPGRIALRKIVSLVPTRRLDLLRIVHPPVRPGDAGPGAGDPTGWSGRPRGLTAAQYRFARLAPQADYEPLILALKGVQLHYRPTDMLTSKQMQADPELERLFSSILEWGENPCPIEPAEATEFLDAVRAGLAQERLRRPAHRPDYIDWATGELESKIVQFNGLLKADG